MAKDSRLRCRVCGRTPTETRDVVSASAEAFTAHTACSAWAVPRIAPTPQAIAVEEESRHGHGRRESRCVMGAALDR
jgi:hypothetical protein